MLIRAYRPVDETTVVALWEACGLVRPWNDPHRDIERKLTEQPELFLVGELEHAVVATAMIGFDGHRGWLYYLAVAPAHQGKAFGTRLVREAETLLRQRGCPKLNLLVRASNAGVIEFYRKLGYSQDEAISLGRRLIADQPSADGLGQTS
ncbi:MAG TPA: GNAT family acetyltransferase [Burkholderiaceae bacterium]|nr:GNAT family acetyltransferase [Burkholderiaceae bacterium]